MTQEDAPPAIDHEQDEEDADAEEHVKSDPVPTEDDASTTPEGDK